MSFRATPPTRTSLNTSHTVSMPVPAMPRAWHDRHGEFLAEAYYCGTVGSMIRLQETEGTVRDIPVSVLSREDVAYLNSSHADQGIGSGPPFYYPSTPSDTSDDLSADGFFQSTFPTPQVSYTLTMPQSDTFVRDHRRNQRPRPNITLANAPDRTPQANIYSEVPHAEPPPYQPNNPSLSPYSRTDSGTRYFHHPSSDLVTSTAQDQLSADSAPVDWFKIFLDAGCEISDCMRYEGVFRQLQVHSKAALSPKHNDLRAMGLDKDDIMRIMDAIGMNPKEKAFGTGKGLMDMFLPDTPAVIAFAESTFAPLPDPVRADIFRAGSFGQSVAPTLNSTTVQESPSHQRPATVDSSSASHDDSALRGVPDDGISAVGEGRIAGSHRDNELSERRQHSVASSASSSGPSAGPGSSSGSWLNRDRNILNPFSSSRPTPQSTTIGSSIAPLLQTALPPLMSHGKPLLEGVSPTPFSGTASSTGSGVSLDDGISEPAEPTKAGESSTPRRDDSNLPKGRLSTSTQQGPFSRHGVPRLPSLVPNEFDPAELLRSESIESLPDELQQTELQSPKPKERPRPVDIVPRTTWPHPPSRKSIPSHISGIFGSKAPTPHPSDNQDLLMAIVNAKGIVRQSIAHLCENLRSRASADARLVAFIRRRETTGIRHEFVMIQARYPSSKTIWMRLERGVKGSISIFRLKSQGVADDVATLGTDESSLIDAARIPSTEEASVSFTNQSSTSLRDLGRILTIVCEEAEKYDLFKENCIFFASVLQEILVWEKYGGQLDSGTLNHRFLSHDARRRIFQRLT